MSMALFSKDKMILHFGRRHVLFLLIVQTWTKELYLLNEVQKVFIFQMVTCVMC